MSTQRQASRRRQSPRPRRKTWRGRSRDCSEISGTALPETPRATPMPCRILAFIVVAQLSLLPSALFEPKTPGADLAQLIDIGGSRKLYFECAGAGSPIVLLEAGL